MMQIERRHPRKFVCLGSKNKKHLRGSTQAQIHPMAITLAIALEALVSIIAKGSIVTFILPHLCFLYQFRNRVAVNAKRKSALH